MSIPTARLIMIMGLPGSGKTYFARALAQHTGAAHFNSDRIRKEEEERPSYSAHDRALIYERMFDRVIGQLEKGKTVIVDATFSKAAYRAPYLDWAKEHRVPVHILCMEASERIIAERVSKKRPDSDADLQVYEKIKAEYEPVEQTHKVLRSDAGSTADNIAAAMHFIERPTQTHGP